MWVGEGGMEHVRTVKEPKQAIPTFEQTVALLMQVHHVHSSSVVTLMFYLSRRTGTSSSTLT
jgi:hypothetical protein